MPPIWEGFTSNILSTKVPFFGRHSINMGRFSRKWQKDCQKWVFLYKMFSKTLLVLTTGSHSTDYYYRDHSTDYWQNIFSRNYFRFFHTSLCVVLLSFKFTAKPCYLCNSKFFHE